MSNLQHRSPSLGPGPSGQWSVQNTMRLFDDCCDHERRWKAYHGGASLSLVPYWSWDYTWNAGKRHDDRCDARPGPQLDGSVCCLWVWEGNMCTNWEGSWPPMYIEPWWRNIHQCLGTFTHLDTWQMELLLLIHQQSYMLHTNQPDAC